MSQNFKLTGFFQEHHPKSSDSLSTCVTEVCEDKSLITQYFKDADWLSITMGLTYSKHVLSQGQPLKEGTAVFTDGVWIWPSYMVAYFRMHDIVLDKQFLKYIRKRNYKIQPMDKQQETAALSFVQKASKLGFNANFISFSEKIPAKIATLRDLRTRRPLLAREKIELDFLQKIQAADNLELLQSIENELISTPTDPVLIQQLLRNINEKKAFY